MSKYDCKSNVTVTAEEMAEKWDVEKWLKVEFPEAIKADTILISSLESGYSVKICELNVIGTG